MLIININLNELIEGIGAATLKGKYGNTGGSKRSSIDNTLTFIVSKDIPSVLISCSSDTMASMVRVGITPVNENKIFKCDAEVLVKYLKTFKGQDVENVDICIGEGFLNLVCGLKRAKIAQRISETNLDIVEKLMSCNISDTNASFSKVTFNTKLTLNANVLSTAIKNAGIVGSAIYKLDYNNEETTITQTHTCVISSKDSTNSQEYDERLLLTNAEGESATVEFTAPLEKFCKKDSEMFIWFNDDSPILITDILGTRRLIIAPYVRG